MADTLERHGIKDAENLPLLLIMEDSTYIRISLYSVYL